MPFSRLLLLTLLVFLIAPLAAQKVLVTVPGCEEQLYKKRFNGVGFVVDKALEKDEDGIYFLNNAVDQPKIAYIGTLEGNPVPVLLDGKESFSVSGNCRDITKAIISGSKQNDAYQQLKREFRKLNETSQRLTRTLSVSKPNTPAYEQTVAELKANDEEKVAKLSALQAEGKDFLASVLAVNLYTSYVNSQKGYNNEVMYFVNERFQYADFSKPVYQENPWVFEGFREFANTLAKARVPDAMLQRSIASQLELVADNASVYKFALGGTIAGLNAAQKSIAGSFAKQYVAKFKADEPEAAAALEVQIQKLAAFETGAVAPEFAQMSIDSSAELGPQSFRGKVLLIDFWASWCGPCRRENPNVVKMYNRFKDEGFDILGVSLDKNFSRWKTAVEKDQLTWPQVSDLRGWQNKVALQYGVRSIPATVLLDREGRIVARNLRGKQLEEKVAELMEKG